MGEESSDTSESDNNDDNQRMPDDFFPGEAKMSNDEAEIQRHTSVQVITVILSNFSWKFFKSIEIYFWRIFAKKNFQSNSNSECSLNEINLGAHHLPTSGIALLNQAQHHHLTPETRKFRTRSNDSTRSDLSDVSFTNDAFKGKFYSQYKIHCFYQDQLFIRKFLTWKLTVKRGFIDFVGANFLAYLWSEA